MLGIFLKIFKTKKTVIDAKEFQDSSFDVAQLGKKIDEKAKKLFRGSLAIRQVDAGSDNACEQELVALSNAFYDADRFGVHFVASPKHADMLLVTGPVTRNMEEPLKRAYETMPDPKIVVAVGDDAINGGIFKDSYAIVGGVANVLPVDYNIPGNPPSPKDILTHLLKILEDIDSKRLNK